VIGRLEQVPDQEGGGRLPVGASDADDPELGGRVAVEGGGDRGHRRARVLDAGLGHVEIERPLDDERRGTRLDGRRREIVAVGPLSREAEQERAGASPAAVVGEVPDLHGTAPRQLGGHPGGSQQLSQLHPARF
jgi:hypothetical protein